MLDPEFAKIIEKIRALQAVADSTTNEAEAAAFSAKVAGMLAHYGLTHSDLADKAIAPVIEEVAWNLLYPHPWTIALAQGVARLYMCDMYRSSYIDAKSGKLRPNVIFVGRVHNAVIAKSMTEYLVATTFRAGAEYTKRLGIKKGMPEYSKTKQGFEKGFGFGLHQRLTDMRAQQLAEGAQRGPEGNPRNLPALYEDEDALIKGYLDNLGGMTKKKVTARLNEHSREGRLESANVSLNSQISGGDDVGALPAPPNALPPPDEVSLGA